MTNTLAFTFLSHCSLDRDDTRKRDMERRKRRRIRWEDDSDQSFDSYDDDEGPSGHFDYRRTMDWALAEATIRSMKRLTNGGGRSSTSAAETLAASLSRFGYGSGGGAGGGMRMGNAFDRLSGPPFRP